MFLILQVTSSNAGALGAASRMVFTQQGGTIGRRDGNDWVLADPHVSGSHARIRAMGGTFFLEDNDSGNGVLVNGNRVHPGEPFPLKDGDVLFIDPFDISVQLAAVMPTAPVAAPPVGAWQPMAPAPPPMQARPVAPIGSLDDLIGPGSVAAPDEYNALLDSAPPASMAPIPSVPRPAGQAGIERCDDHLDAIHGPDTTACGAIAGAAAARGRRSDPNELGSRRSRPARDAVRALHATAAVRRHPPPHHSGVI
jgi:type VI secretion system FHA domain protein